MPSYSGLWNGVYGINYSALGSNNTKELNNTERVMLSKTLSRTRGGRVLGVLIKALNGAAAGGTATATHRRITPDVNPASPEIGGGVRPTELKTDISRATTAADETMIDNIIDRTFAPNPYPTDRSRNGGGNKRNRF